jgi:hypothetical protein
MSTAVGIWLTSLKNICSFSNNFMPPNILVMKSALEDLPAEMGMLIESASSIEKKLSLMSSRKRTNFDLDLPINELITFKTEVEKAN